VNFSQIKVLKDKLRVLLHPKGSDMIGIEIMENVIGDYGEMTISTFVHRCWYISLAMTFLGCVILDGQALY
jgi:hypothetical protein